jgi:hypothetical protein
VEEKLDSLSDEEIGEVRDYEKRTRTASPSWSNWTADSKILTAVSVLTAVSAGTHLEHVRRGVVAG